MLNVIHKRASVGEVSSDGRLRVVLSTESEDRSGDIVRLNGWHLSAFKQNPVVLFSHRGDQIVGTADVSLEDKSLVADITLAEPGTAPVVDYVRSLIRQKILKAASAGFRAIKYAFLDNGGIEFIEQELLECSLVGVPANPEALAIAKQFDLSPSDFVISAAQPEVVTPPEPVDCDKRKALRLWVSAARIKYCPANVGERGK